MGTVEHTDAELATAFWGIFSRVLKEAVSPGKYAVSDLTSWDSLRHVELIFALEEKFGIDIAPNEVVELYTDTDAVLAYLTSKVG